MRLSIRALGFVSIAVFALALVRPAEADMDVALWTTGRIHHQIDEDWSTSIWGQGRLTDDMSEADQLLVMPSLHFRVIPHVKLGVGFTYWAKRSSDEVDLSQELALAHKFGDLAIGNRFRLEERFINNVDDMVLRGRYRVHLAHPLGGGSLYAVAWNEVFTNLNWDDKGEGPPNGYEQNRLFGGLGIRAGGHWRFELGYLWRNFVRRGDADRRDDHIASLTVFYDTKGATPPRPDQSESHY